MFRLMTTSAFTWRDAQLANIRRRRRPSPPPIQTSSPSDTFLLRRRITRDVRPLSTMQAQWELFRRRRAAATASSAVTVRAPSLMLNYARTPRCSPVRVAATSRVGWASSSLSTHQNSIITLMASRSFIAR